MNELSSYEKILKRKISGKYLAYQVSLILFYAILTVSLWFFCALTAYFPALVIFCAVAVVCVIFFTQKFIRVEYEYSIVGNIFIFSKIYGKSYRKTVFEIEINKILNFSVYGEASLPLENFSLISGLSDASAEDICFFVFKEGTEDLTVFLFENDDEIRKRIKKYNPKLIFKSYAS